MKNLLLYRATQAVMVAISASALAVAQDAAKPAKPETDLKSDSSYAVGYSAGDAFAQNFAAHGVRIDDFDMELFMKGFTTAAKGKKPELEIEKLQAAMSGLAEFIEAREKTLAEENLKTGKEFLEKNAKRKGVITNESGLQYEILAKGGEGKYVAPADGKSPNKIFMVNYKGTMLDGTEFDASAPGKPVKMSLDVVDGFREALTSMPVGAKWKLYLPSAMAYGERRASVDIGPNTTLIFELELVEIKDAPPEVQMPFEGLQIPPGQ
jgi:FKBP-type peptidyl-prolyl cis-trans isomerase